MLDDALKLPDDPSVLKNLVASLASELKSRDLLIEKLKYQLAGLRRHQFGSRSENLDQLELTLEEAEIALAAEAPVQQAAPTDDKRQPKRRPLPDNLPRNETVLSAGEACASCGGALKRLGEDVTEELEYIPGVRHRTRTNGALMAHRGEQDRASAHGLRLLRADHSGGAAVSTDRARPTRSQPSGACAGQQICGSFAALSAEPDLRPRGDRCGTLDPR